jgi:carbonic anhydrase
MERIIAGLRAFSNKIYPQDKALFNSLNEGQKPAAMFITCSDSRIDPNLITQTKPGELFVIRNAGNVIPDLEMEDLSSSAAIEFAVQVLQVKDIIICGHNDCGAMRGLKDIEDIADELPLIARWLDMIKPKCDLKETSLDEIIRLNALQQAEHLHSFPFVEKAIAEDRLKIHAWIYHIGSGKVTDAQTQKEVTAGLDNH